MASVEAEIEALELRLMRAWLAGDAGEAKKLIARDFMAMIGTLPPQLLDRPSFLAGLARDFACTKFAFREVFVRQHGKSAWFVAGAELEIGLGAKVWSGPFLVTGLWRKGTIGGWKLTERSLARLDLSEGFAPAVAKLQLWK